MIFHRFFASFCYLRFFIEVNEHLILIVFFFFIKLARKLRWCCLTNKKEVLS